MIVLTVIYINGVWVVQKQHLTFLEFTVFYRHGLTVFHCKIYGHFLQCAEETVGELQVKLLFTGTSPSGVNISWQTWSNQSSQPNHIHDYSQNTCSCQQQANNTSYSQKLLFQTTQKLSESEFRLVNSE